MFTTLIKSIFRLDQSSYDLAHELVEQQIFFRRELSERVDWFITLRWLVIVIAPVSTFLAGFFQLRLPLLPITIIIGIILGYNIIFTAIARCLRRPPPKQASMSLLATHGQIVCDLTALYALIYYTGGFYSPLVFCVLFHIVLTGILLEPVYAYFYAALILAALGISALLQFTGIIHPNPLTFAAALSPHDQLRSKAILFFFFLTFLILITTFLITTIKHSLRFKGRTLLVFCKELDLANSKLTTLYQMVKEMALCSEIQNLLDIATKRTAGIMGVKACSIKLLEENQNALRFASTYGLSQDYLLKGSIRIDKSPINQKIIAGDLCSIGKIEEQDYFQFPEDIRKEGIHSMICLPLKVEKRILGVFCVYGGEDLRFTDQDVNFFTLTSDLTALALQNLKRDLNKSWFLQKAAHQLRSPVNAVNSMLKVVRKGYLGLLAPKQEEMLRQCENRLESLNGMIQDLLKLGIKKEGIMPITLHPLDLKPLFERLATFFQSQADEKGVSLVLTLEENLPPILAHETLLDDIFTNLLSNAVKYTPAGRHVTVSLAADTETRLCLKVTDQGIGIPQAELPQLFTEFFRAENAKALTDQGTGLGLTIVKEALDRLRGTIQIESRQDQGTCVTCCFPAAN